MGDEPLTPTQERMYGVAIYIVVLSVACWVICGVAINERHTPKEVNVLTESKIR